MDRLRERCKYVISEYLFYNKLYPGTFRSGFDMAQCGWTAIIFHEMMNKIEIKLNQTFVEVGFLSSQT